MGRFHGNQALRPSVEHYLRNRLLVWMFRMRSMGVPRSASRRLFSLIERSLVRTKVLR